MVNPVVYSAWSFEDMSEKLERRIDDDIKVAIRCDQHSVRIDIEPEYWRCIETVRKKYIDSGHYAFQFVSENDFCKSYKLSWNLYA